MTPSPDKLCMVCGDKALGYNFNAVTCESCKAFFRRNALSSKDFTCPFNEICEITVITRRFCQKCRLEKCFTIGMRKEYIMSEEDKILKKLKIEQNRSKRKSAGVNEKVPIKIKKDINAKKNNGGSATDENDEDVDIPSEPILVGTNSGIYEINTVPPPPPPHTNQMFPISPAIKDELNEMFPVISSSTETPIAQPPLPSLDSTSTVIVDRLVNYPEDAGKLINHLMKTPTEAVAVMTKILNSQKDAMRLIGHLIGSPGDALKIISKIMNSPFDALTVFTKFMSSPTDALEIIAKIASSPDEVLQFIQQLMNSPEDALQIMNKFMNSPAEALKMLNKMVNNSNVDSTTQSKEQTMCHIDHNKEDTNPMIKSMLETNLPKIKEDNSPTTSSIPTASTSAAAQISCDQPQQATGSNESSSSTIIRNILNDVSDEPIQTNSLESVICDAIHLEYDVQPPFAKSPANINTRELNEAERAKLNELIAANKALYAPLDEDLTGLDECSINVSLRNYNYFIYTYIVFDC